MIKLSFTARDTGVIIRTNVVAEMIQELRSLQLHGNNAIAIETAVRALEKAKSTIGDAAQGTSLSGSNIVIC